MLVRKTLHEICSEVIELKELRKNSASMVAVSATRGNKYQMDKALSEYNHFHEIIVNLLSIEVEYDDKYAEEKEE